MRRLGLGPGATLAEAKAAWRRAASRLHPDRAGPEGDQDLAEINAAYQRLQAFYGHHGRFPGATERLASNVPKTRSRLGRRTLAAMALGVAVFVLWPQATPEVNEARGEEIDGKAHESLDAVQREPPALSRPFDAPVLRPKITLGMSAPDVARIAGEPLLRSPERWDYGPSEVRFEKGKVSGWHVSPLRPLPVEDEPPEDASGRPWPQAR